MQGITSNKKIEKKIFFIKKSVTLNFLNGSMLFFHNIVEDFKMNLMHYHKRHFYWYFTSYLRHFEYQYLYTLI